jgi:hypothetical protein
LGWKDPVVVRDIDVRKLALDGADPNFNATPVRLDEVLNRL